MVGIETNTWSYTSCEIAVCGAIHGCPFEPGLGVRPKSRMIARFFNTRIYYVVVFWQKHAYACVSIFPRPTRRTPGPMMSLVTPLLLLAAVKVPEELTWDATAEGNAEYFTGMFTVAV